jgi:hypothetical protein
LWILNYFDVVADLFYRSRSRACVVRVYCYVSKFYIAFYILNSNNTAITFAM